MSGETIGDRMKSKAKDVDPVINEVSIFKQLIKERVHPLDLVRELLSNAGAKEVGATRIEISYTRDKDGHIFEVTDDGCGMDYTGNVEIPHRIDKFIGLGLSQIVDVESDEFSWKGLGSKLAYQSRRVEIETCRSGEYPHYDVRINEPWETINNNLVPKPRISEHPPQEKGTRIRVIGHPPHRDDEPFTFQKIKTFLQHRTFAGFTRARELEPTIVLSVLGDTKEIPFGFPEFKSIDFDGLAHDGLDLDEENGTLYINMTPKSSASMNVRVKGFITWNARRHDLANENLNTGLILSVRGIPYFNLDMEEFGVTGIRTARPGENKTCLVVECDAIQDELNISRSGLVDSAKTVEFRKMVGEIFQRIESSEQYLKFRRLTEREKLEKQSDVLAEEKRLIERKDQNWVVYEGPNCPPVVLLREPKYEHEVNALLWKLESLGALPFETFRTLAYLGAVKGPDLLVHFLEEKGGEPQRGTVFEVENNFYSYKSHGHSPGQYPKVICWDIPSSGRKGRLNKTDKNYKYTMTWSCPVFTDGLGLGIKPLEHGISSRSWRVTGDPAPNDDGTGCRIPR